MFCFMSNIATKVSSYDAMPCWIVFFVKFFLNICCYVLFYRKFFQCLTTRQQKKLFLKTIKASYTIVLKCILNCCSTLYRVDLHIFWHIGYFDYCFRFAIWCHFCCLRMIWLTNKTTLIVRVILNKQSVIVVKKGVESNTSKQK